MTGYNSSSNWQFLGDLKLPVTSISNSVLQDFLYNLLSTLSLDGDLSVKIFKTLLNVITRISSTHVENQTDQIHLKLFSSTLDEKSESPWGYFLVEKGKKSIGNSEFINYAIDVYLYRDN